MFPFIAMGACLLGSLGALKMTVKAGALVATLWAAKKGLEADWNNTVDLNPAAQGEEGYRLEVVPPGSMPNAPELEGEWLLTESESDRLTPALQQKYETGITSADLRRLMRARENRGNDPKLQVVAGVIRNQVQNLAG